MAATPFQTLLDEAEIYASFGAIGTAGLLRLALMARAVLAVNPAADVSAQGLMTYGQCYACLGLSSQEIMEISLMDMLSQALAA